MKKLSLLGFLLLTGCQLTSVTRNFNLKPVAQESSTNPEKILVGKWLNSDKVPSLNGKVSIIQFFTFGCINCKANLPYLNKIQMSKRESVQVLGVHTPELEFESLEKNVKRALGQLDVGYPVLLDPEKENWRSWEVDAWPTVFVLDKKGSIRFKWVGELESNGNTGYEQILTVVDKILEESER